MTTDLLFLASITIVSLLQTGCSAAECSNPPPGIRRMVRGVDITELDLNPIGIAGQTGFKHPVINFTCNRGNEWTSPMGGKYQLPDQIWHLNTVPGGWLAADVRLYKSHHDVRKSLTRSVGGKGKIWKFSFSASYSYSKMQHSISNSSHYISDVSAHVSSTMADFIPSWILKMDEFAQYYVNNLLKGDFTSNPEAYRRFINEFGTHYFSKAYFGGYIRIVLETLTNYFSSTTDRKVKKEAKASFLKFISVNGGQVSQSTTVDQRFSSQTTQSVAYFGGYTNLLTKDGIQMWQPTVFKDPWLFSGALKPISDLIADPVKKASMVQAVADHVMRTYLNELERLLSISNSRTCPSSGRRSVNPQEILRATILGRRGGKTRGSIRSRTRSTSSRRQPQRSRDAAREKLRLRVSQLKDAKFLDESKVDTLSKDIDAYLRARPSARCTSSERRPSRGRSGNRRSSSSGSPRSGSRRTSSTSESRRRSAKSMSRRKSLRSRSRKEDIEE